MILFQASNLLCDMHVTFQYNFSWIGFSSSGHEIPNSIIHHSSFIFIIIFSIIIVVCMPVCIDICMYDSHFHVCMYVMYVSSCNECNSCFQNVTSNIRSTLPPPFIHHCLLSLQHSLATGVHTKNRPICHGSSGNSVDC